MITKPKGIEDLDAAFIVSNKDTPYIYITPSKLGQKGIMLFLATHETDELHEAMQFAENYIFRNWLDLKVTYWIGPNFDQYGNREIYESLNSFIQENLLS